MPVRRKMATSAESLAFQSDILVGLVQRSDVLPLQSRRVEGPTVMWTTAKNLAGVADYSFGEQPRHYTLPPHPDVLFMTAPSTS